MPHATNLTDIEVNHFFNVEIGMPEPTMVKLREEGIVRPEHLVEFNEKDVKSIAEALRKAGGLVPSGTTSRASMMSAPGVRIGTRALIRLEASIQIMRCYETVNHKPTASQLRYDPVNKNFKLEFNALKY